MAKKKAAKKKTSTANGSVKMTVEVPAQGLQVQLVNSVGKCLGTATFYSDGLKFRPSKGKKIPPSTIKYSMLAALNVIQ